MEYPELAANEFFCLSVAKRLYFSVPEFRLSGQGRALVISRFDLADDGRYLGFEDFCVLNAFQTARQYDGGYETRLFRRAGELVDAADRPEALAALFKLIVLTVRSVTATPISKTSASSIPMLKARPVSRRSMISSPLPPISPMT